MQKGDFIKINYVGRLESGEIFDLTDEEVARKEKVVPEKMFKDQKVEIKQGMVVDFGSTKGRIQSVAAGRVTVDFNNPLAGKVLKYDVEVLSKVEETAEKIKGIFSFVGFHDAQVTIKEKEAVITVKMPSEIKNKISQMILDNVKEIEKMTYEESYERK
ncbi:MAG: hypothetical protein NT120_03535 [Candidatus Aenigmarchaeota archaeon]|nr:hypothetical protein [Candidatus Aenigmarchaeota archaeon]